MLLIGETGVGKSSLVAFIRNYAKQRGASFDVSKLEAFDMEREAGIMTSQTKSTAVYRMDVGNLAFYLTDTPGLADSEGEKQTKKNVENIISRVRTFDYINCICLVINGSEARLTPVIDLVFKEIVKLLPGEVLDNTIVIFTKTVKKSSLNFSMETIKKNYGLSIPSSCTFMLDNPFCAWIKEKKESVPEFDEIYEDFIKEFNKLDKIFSKIEDFEPVESRKFGELSEIIQKIDLYLANIELETYNRKRTHELHTEMKSHLQTKQALQSSVDQTNIALVESNSENITCAICFSNCHEDCSCWWTTGLFGNIKRCEIFRSGACSCTHSVIFHKKWSYKYTKDTTKTRNIETEIDEQKGKVKQVNSELTVMNDKLTTSSSEVMDLMVILRRLGPQNTYANVTTTEVKRMHTFLSSMPKFDEKRILLKKLAEIKQACINTHAEA